METCLAICRRVSICCRLASISHRLGVGMSDAANTRVCATASNGGCRISAWRTHSCVPRPHSCGRLCLKYDEKSRLGICSRPGVCCQLAVGPSVLVASQHSCWLRTRRQSPPESGLAGRTAGPATLPELLSRFELMSRFELLSRLDFLSRLKSFSRHKFFSNPKFFSSLNSSQDYMSPRLQRTGG